LGRVYSNYALVILGKNGLCFKDFQSTNTIAYLLICQK
jgi:hypothetical protein